MAEEKKTATKKQVRLQIDLDEQTAQGAYTNLTFVNMSETEFVLDFVYVQPNQPKAKVRSRVIMNPQHARRLLSALERNIELYEKRFGPLAKPKTPPRAPDDGGILQ